MKFILVIFLGAAFNFSTVGFAGPGHGHSHAPAIKPEKATELAKEKVKDLVKSAKVDAAWDGIKPNAPFKKKFSKSEEWVVVFENPKQLDKKKAKLHIFISLEGRITGSNFTGK